jgi:hypothetical protein
VHELTKAQAQRIVVRAQLLDAPRPTDLLAVVQRLTWLRVEVVRLGWRRATAEGGREDFGRTGRRVCDLPRKRASSEGNSNV